VAKKYQLTWNGKQQRWFKKFDRRQYAVSVKELRSNYPHLVKSDTKEGSYLAANQWWHDKVRTLTTHPQEAVINQGIETRRQLAAWCQLEGRDDLRERILAEIDTLKSALRANTPLTAGNRRLIALASGQVEDTQEWTLGTLLVDLRHYSTPDRESRPDTTPARYHGEDWQTWANRLTQVAKHEAWETKQKGLTFPQAVTMFLDNHAASPARIANLRLYLDKFLKWKANDRLQVSAVDLLNYKAELLKLVEEGKSLETARSEMIGLKQFIQWCWETELLDDLPRNLRSKSLTIGNGEGKKVTWTDAQVQTALTNANEKMKLFLLLMLNCGMYSSDISALQQEDVDWEKGTVKWARAKTGKKNGLHFTLWPETFALLKKYRSNHPTLVFVTSRGTPLKVSRSNGHYEIKTDRIGASFRNWNTGKKLGLPALKNLRKTARNKLENHEEFARYAQAFLQQAPRSVDEKWYRKPSQEAFDRALIWLRQQFIK
jgi:integrase